MRSLLATFSLPNIIHALCVMNCNLLGFAQVAFDIDVTDKDAIPSSCLMQLHPEHCQRRRTKRLKFMGLCIYITNSLNHTSTISTVVIRISTEDGGATTTASRCPDPARRYQRSRYLRRPTRRRAELVSSALYTNLGFRHAARYLYDNSKAKNICTRYLVASTAEP